jgi:hypothetical protein
MLKRMKFKKPGMIPCIFLYASLCISAAAQENLSVGLEHPVYYFLTLAEIKGALTGLSRAKPYSESRVIEYLRRADENREKLDPHELLLLQAYLNEFTGEHTGPENGNLATTGDLGLFAAGLRFTSDYRTDLSDVSHIHMFNALLLYIRGDIGESVSYYGAFGVTFDKVDTECFAPYDFSKQWDGFHLGFGEPRYSIDEVMAAPYFSFVLENEITAAFFDNNLILRFARMRRDWGQGEGNLYLSNSARPFEALELEARLTPGVNLAYTVGSLGNWLKENESGSGGLSFQKMLTIQMLEFFPFDWLYLSVAGIAVWGNRFNLGYMNPLMYPVINQNVQGNVDNVFQVVNCCFTIPGIAGIYLSLLVDEMEFAGLKELFTRPRNMFAFQVGARIPLPGLPAFMLTLQYTKIEPFVYAHYPEQNLDMSYTNDNENLGFHLPPNSDEFLVQLQDLIEYNLFLTLAYRLIRHGTNDPALMGGAPAIYGDVNTPFDYSQTNAYPDKSFLNDGIYDWNHIITLQASYTFERIPLTLTLAYSFCYTGWDANESGVSPPADTVKNIISLKIDLF